jgi:hypothetical protein
VLTPRAFLRRLASQGNRHLKSSPR